MCERCVNILYKTVLCLTKCQHCNDRHFRRYFPKNQTSHMNSSQQSQSTNSPHFTQSQRLNTCSQWSVICPLPRATRIQSTPFPISFKPILIIYSQLHPDFPIGLFHTDFLTLVCTFFFFFQIYPMPAPCPTHFSLLI